MLVMHEVGKETVCYAMLSQ